MSASTEKKNRTASREAGTYKKTVAQQEEAAKKAKEKKIWTVCGILVAVLLIVVLFLSSPLVYRNTTAVTIGGEKFSPAQVNYNYANQFYNFANQYGQYASMFGLDTQYGLTGLKSQECSMTDGGTWKDYFVDTAITAMTQTKAISDYAKENGIELTEEEIASVNADLAGVSEYAEASGFSSVKKFLNAYYGNGVNEQIALEQALRGSLIAKAAQQYSDSLTYTAEELKEKYDSYNGDYDYFDVCYYNVPAETVDDGEGNFAATEETKAAAKTIADAILEEYNALAEETDVEVRLNEAIARAGESGECIHSERAYGSNIAFKDWAAEDHVEGDAAVAESGDDYVVAAFISRDINDYNLAQVRHILVKAVADEEGNYTDEAKAEAKARAEEIYDEWRFGMKTEDSFAELAELYSEDAGSNTNGGLYDNVMKGQMVEEFDKFCFEGHAHGDSAVIYGEAAGSYAGYHVMYYVGEGENCRDYIASSELKSADEQSWLESLTEGLTPVKGFWMRYVG
ncbi:MAG: peptidylprolyl isomerase [Eubacteriales bacterium]|nr:peptidylprolyl isomerase [Eubacteriales bacterium]